MANIIATFVIAYNVAVLVAMSLYVANPFLQVSAYVLAVIFSISVIQNLFRGRKN